MKSIASGKAPKRAHAGVDQGCNSRGGIIKVTDGAALIRPTARYRRTDRTSNTLRGQVLANVLANVLGAQNSQGFDQAGCSRGRFSGVRRRNRCCTAPISSMPWSVEKTPLKRTPSQADQHQYLRHQMAEGMFPSSVERPFPRPGQIQNRALHRRRQGWAKPTAKRREQSERPLRGRGNARESWRRGTKSSSLARQSNSRYPAGDAEFTSSRWGPYIHLRLLAQKESHQLQSRASRSRL